MKRRMIATPATSTTMGRCHSSGSAVLTAVYLFMASTSAFQQVTTATSRSSSLAATVPDINIPFFAAIDQKRREEASAAAAVIVDALDVVEDSFNEEEEEEALRETSPVPPKLRIKKRKKKNGNKPHNPAMSDPAFLRKRTAKLLKLTASSADDDSEESLGGGRMKADVKSFHFLMDAWAFSGESDAADQAKRLLERMEDLSHESPSMGIAPDVRSYTKAINAISRSASATAGVEAELLFEKMIFLSATNPALHPNTFTYQAVVEAHANAADRAPESAQRAAELCQEMINKYHEGDVEVTPTARAFHAAVTALGQSGEVGAAEQAEALFGRLEELYTESGIEKAKPTTYNYNGLIAALANCGEPGAAARAEQVLERMERLYKEGNNEVRPTTVSFNSVIDAYAKSGEEGAEQKAEDILRHMEDLYESGENVGARPNVRSFNTVINVLAKSGLPDSATRAQDMLDLMERLYEQGNDHVRPDVHSFCTVINAWARSQDDQKAQHALNTFREMKLLYEDGKNPGVKPNVVAYNAVMNACAFTGGNVQEQNRAVEIAHSVLKGLEQSEYGSPDQVTYGTFLKVCANQMPDCSTREQIAKVLFKKCAKAGQVGNMVLAQLRTMMNEEMYFEMVGRRLDEDVDMHDLPKEWWCNVVEGKWRRKQRNLGSSQ